MSVFLREGTVESFTHSLPARVSRARVGGWVEARAPSVANCSDVVLDLQKCGDPLTAILQIRNRCGAAGEE
jgi:hypothetical protein